MLEVGFNRGKFITELAERFPDHNVVGIEIRKRFVVRLAQVVGAAGYPRNLRVAWGDAKVLLPALFTPNSISAMFITFPDPWWKKRHEKRRLVDTQFAAGIAERLTEGGVIWVKSDVPMIADEIREGQQAAAKKWEKEVRLLKEHQSTNQKRLFLLEQEKERREEELKAVEPEPSDDPAPDVDPAAGADDGSEAGTEPDGDPGLESEPNGQTGTGDEPSSDEASQEAAGAPAPPQAPPSDETNDETKTTSPSDQEGAL